MFIPLGTDRPLRHPVIFTYALIGLNLIVYAYQRSLHPDFTAAMSPEYVQFMATYALSRSNFHWYQLVTASFLHAGEMHILGNMLFLYVFGPNLEDRLGKMGFLILYILGGCAAMGAYVVFSSGSVIGASGSIAALTGAYLVMFPRVMVKVLNIFVLGIFYMKAWWFIAFAVGWDLFAQYFMRDNVAHTAHLGGYAFGAAVAFLLLWTRLVPREPYDLFTATKQAYRRRQIAQVSRDYQRAVQRQVGSDGSAGDGLQVVHDEVAVMRSKVTNLLSAEDWAGAAVAYKTLADTYGHLPRGSTLSRKNQYDLANYLYLQQDYNAATYAYERFLEAYAKDPESPQIRLLLGRIYSRHLNDPIKAKSLLKAALADLRDEETKTLARQELEALG